MNLDGHVVLDRPLRRMLVVLGVLLALDLAWSLWRGESLGYTVTHALVGLGCGGFVFACHFWARRTD
jgi:hypothetical protein